MKSIKCKVCQKVIEGYKESHVQFLMRQHMMKHENEEKKLNNKEEKNGIQRNKSRTLDL